MTAFEIALKINAIDNASKVIGGIAGKFGGMSDQLAKFGLASAGIREAAGALEGFSSGYRALDTASQSMKTLGEDGRKLAPILKETALSMAKDIPFAASEIQGAMTDALASGIEPTKEGLSVFANTAAKLAAGSGTQLGVVVKGLAGTLNAYGASASEATKYADIFFDVNNAGVTSIQELNAYMPALNASANALGLSFADAGRGIALMTQKGVSTADSSTAMKALFQEMAKPSADFAKFMKTAGISLDQVQSGPLEERLKVIRAGLEKTGVKVDTIFGSSEAGTAIKVMTGDMKKMSDVFAQVDAKGSGSAANAFKEMSQSVDVQTKQMEANIDSFKIQTLNSMGGFGVGLITASSQFTKFSGEITALAGLKALVPPGIFGSLVSGAKTAFSAVSGYAGNAFGAMKSGMMNAATAVRGFSLSSVTSGLSSMKEGLSSSMLSLRIFTAQKMAAMQASNLFSGGLSGFAKTVGGSLMSGLRSAVTGIMGMNMALLTSPVTWIAIGIAAAAFLIYKNWGSIAGFFKDTFSSVKAFFGGFMDGISAAFNTVWGIFEEVKAAFKPIIDAIFPVKQAVTGVSGSAITLTKNFSAFKDAGIVVGQIVGTAFRVIATPIMFVIKLIGQTIGFIMSLGAAGMRAGKFIVDSFAGVITMVSKVWGLVGSFKTFLLSVFSGANLKDAGIKLIESLWEGIKEMAGKLLDGVKGIIGGIKNIFSGGDESGAAAAKETAKAAATAPTIAAPVTAQAVAKTADAEPSGRMTAPPEAPKLIMMADTPASPKAPAPKSSSTKGKSAKVVNAVAPTEVNGEKDTSLDMMYAADFASLQDKGGESPKMKPMVTQPIVMPIENLGTPTSNSSTSISTIGTSLESKNTFGFGDGGSSLKLPPSGELVKLPSIKLPEMSGLKLPSFEGVGTMLKPTKEQKKEDTSSITYKQQDAGSGSVTLNFIVNVNGAEGQKAIDIKADVEKILRDNAPEFARQVERITKQNQRFQFSTL